MLAPLIENKNLASFISTNEPLASKTWFQTGGPAKLYATPSTPEQFAQAISFAHQHQQDIFVLGEGANILIADEGFDGLVIHPPLKSISHQGDLVMAGAGVSLPDLIEYCLAHNLIGLEEFSGIPGTVGGAVFINLHYFEFLISQFLVSAQIVEKENGNLSTVDNAWFNFGYNQSTLHAKKHYLIEATFKLNKVSDYEVAFARGRRKEIIRHRARRYPQSHTCGSFFRNFHPDEVTLQIDGKKMIYVAYYLDKIGVKGNLKVGDAMVSYQHANMIVNCGKGTSADIIAVARSMQELVHKEYGIIPQTECLMVGFKQWPLL
jgi:UDP-N-acetylmuramate dehydrogenase